MKRAFALLKTASGILYAACMLLVNLPAAQAQNALMLPVELMVENGEVRGTAVNVMKNGQPVFASEGKNSMKLRLDLNESYLLVFSKEGFISKSISVNTSVPPERALQLFDPYKIGVKLFKQYEGVNIVVYSQPVAHIHFNPSIDDFDYDVDYTKSILSMLKEAEDQLEIKAAQERKGLPVAIRKEHTLDEKHKMTSQHASGIMTDNKSSSTYPGSMRTNSIVNDPHLQTSTVNGRNAPEGDTAGKGTGSGAGNEPIQMVPQEGKEAATTLNKNAGSETAAAILPATGEDSPSAGQHSLGEDVKEAGSFTANAERPPVNSADFISGSVYRTTVEEPTRSVTTVFVKKGNRATEYRKVEYKWGAVYYFINNSFSISPSVYFAATGFE